jgi:organic hydroperoxide reductase OsmC/OhrA
MLLFLDMAAREGYVVDRYLDAARGDMQKNAERKDAVTCVTLQPAVAFSGVKVPTDAGVQQLHHEAHESCFLANSVKTEILVQGSWSYTE